MSRNNIKTIWKPLFAITLLIILNGCASLGDTTGEIDPRPAYHVVTKNQDGISVHFSHDGTHWTSSALPDLAATDCYDIAVSPNDGQRYLAYIHIEAKGDNSLNVLRGKGARGWQSTPSRLTVKGESQCTHPEIRHLSGELYGIVWLYNGGLYSAIYDAGQEDGQNLYLNEAVQSDWFRLINIKELSFAYDDNTVYVVWTPNSRDRIMTMEGTLQGHSLQFDDPVYFLKDYINLSNVIIDDGRLYAVMVTGERLNMLISTSNGLFWRKGPTCYNTMDFPIIVPFLYQDAEGDKYYLKRYDYWGNVTKLQNFTDCLLTDFEVPGEIGDVKRLEYFPGLAPAAQ